MDSCAFSKHLQHSPFLKTGLLNRHARSTPSFFNSPLTPPGKQYSRRFPVCRCATQTALAPHQVEVQTYSGQTLNLNFFPSHLPALFETYSKRLEIRAYTWTDDDLVLFHQCNSGLRIERLPNGRVSVKPASATKTQALQKEIFQQLRTWNEEEDRGKCFSPPGGFFLPLVKSQRSPKVAFTGKERWRLQMVGKPIGGLLMRACPQFCVELATSKESLEEARVKAKEYLIAGCELVWIVYAAKNVVFVYRREFTEDFVVNPIELRGDPFLPDFVLRVDELRAKGVWI